MATPPPRKEPPKPPETAAPHTAVPSAPSPSRTSTGSDPDPPDVTQPLPCTPSPTSCPAHCTSCICPVEQREDECLRGAECRLRQHNGCDYFHRDQREFEMPNVGLINLKDSETGEIVCFDTSSRRQREQYKTRSLQQKITREQIFQRLKIEPLHIFTGENYIDPLRDYFHRRGAKR